MDKLDTTVGILGDLVGFPTVSSDGNLELIAYLSDQLGRLGARTRMTADETGTKANFFATFGPDGDGGIVLSGHTDVVPVADQDWHSDPFAMVERDGRLYGRGSCDMKGFIAASLSGADVAFTPMTAAVSGEARGAQIKLGELTDALSLIHISEPTRPY